MYIRNIEVTNFRLLKGVSLSLEQEPTVIVGRNNSGKTSLTEVFRRLLSDKNPSFSLEDFSINSIAGFKRALAKKLEGAEEDDIRAEIPAIEIKITIAYDITSTSLGPLSEFIIDLDPSSSEAVILIKYKLGNGKIDDLFAGCTGASDPAFPSIIKQVKERIPKLFTLEVFAVDPTNPTNSTSVEFTKLKNLIGAGFINAQRGLDDITHTEKDVLGKVLSKLFKTATTASAPEDLRSKSEALDLVVKELQEKVDEDFNQKLDELLPALQIFGYPGLSDPKLSTETTLNVSNILESHTKIRYGRGEGLFLPETYNGLGSRNLIYMLFQLFEFFRDYQTKPITPGTCIIFIEEPEAHLHPQMQQVFIKQLGEIARIFAENLNGGNVWPVQFVVTTHSTHIANEARFDSIRYFHTDRNENAETKIKDLKEAFSTSGLAADKEFLHKYLTLTRCDLFFADKAILIEGPTERILMPILVEKVDTEITESTKLKSQYITVIEVGGAYAHHFYKFLDFLELQTLVITDLDAVLKETSDKGKVVYYGSSVADGTTTSNAAIKNWFPEQAKSPTFLEELKSKTADDKVNGYRRLAYQIPEPSSSAYARSFEDAFLLANKALFGLVGFTSDEQLAEKAYEKAGEIEKTNFALNYALNQTEWNVPFYIKDGLLWLSKNPTSSISEISVASGDLEVVTT
jgi:putative ATP-dependent endonuclease of the OLD family